MSETPMSDTEAIKEAKRLLSAITSPPRAAATVKKVIGILEELERRAEAAAGLKRESRRGAKPVTYKVQTSEMGEGLSEIRPGHTFRCPKAVYDVLIKVLSEASSPPKSGLTTIEIVTAVKKASGMKIAPHQYGVALRFLIHNSPPLLTRSLNRYRAVDPVQLAPDGEATVSFTTAAKKAWERRREV